jgi:two-component system, OmpR family, sensor histidine kinase KdpD
VIKVGIGKQYLIVVGLISLTSLICFSFSGWLDYKVVAFILLMVVSLVAMFFNILPVLLAALLSALIWDFFFIPPRFTFRIDTAENTLMLLMYFVVALVNAVLTFKIREVEKESRLKEEKANTVKLYNTLLNSLSHELRTPIATIIGATDNLISESTKISEEDKHRLLNEISGASLRLNQQVGNLLNMSRLETGFIQPKRDWVDASELVYSVVNRLSTDAMNHRIEVDVIEGLPLFKLDFGLTETALQNIIQNSIQYTSAGSVIKIKVDCIKDQFVLTVEDNGPGFPEEELSKVFDKFYRLNSSRTGGTGLGLSIVKGFVEAQQGTIALENIAGGGAKFTIQIPAEISYLTNLKNE